MINTEICNAIRNKNLNEFYYDSGTRIVKPYLHGVTNTRNKVLRAFQVDGYSSSEKM